MADRCILHVDCNSFFASVSLLYRPWLRDVPVVVGGNEETRHGIVLAKSEQARQAGVKTGMALWQARQLCPGLTVLPPEYSLYGEFSKRVHEYLSQYTPLVEPFGSDECWIDVTAAVGGDRHKALALAYRIRADIPRLYGITVSVGVSWNKIFAKLGSDLQKPNAVTPILRENDTDIAWQDTIFPLPVEELLYVGPATKRKLHARGERTIGDLARIPLPVLRDSFGVVGGALHAFANGLDTTPVSHENAAPIVKSIGNSCTTPRDLVGETDVWRTINVLAETTGRRLREHGFKCRTIEVWLRGTDLSGITRQHRQAAPTCLTPDIARAAFSLAQKHYGGQPLRSVGIRCSSLVLADDPWQLELGVDATRQAELEALEAAIDGINTRFGKTCVRRAVSICDEGLEGMGTKESQDFAPTGYFR